jgi:hypothetical protein
MRFCILISYGNLNFQNKKALKAFFSLQCTGWMRCALVGGNFTPIGEYSSNV